MFKYLRVQIFPINKVQINLYQYNKKSYKKLFIKHENYNHNHVATNKIKNSNLAIIIIGLV